MEDYQQQQGGTHVHQQPVLRHHGPGEQGYLLQLDNQHIPHAQVLPNELIPGFDQVGRQLEACMSASQPLMSEDLPSTRDVQQSSGLLKLETSQSISQLHWSIADMLQTRGL